MTKIMQLWENELTRNLSHPHVARCLTLPGLSPAVQTGKKKINLSDFLLLAQIWIYSFPPSPIPLFLITLAYSPDLTLATKGQVFCTSTCLLVTEVMLMNSVAGYCAARMYFLRTQESPMSEVALLQLNMPRILNVCLL